MYYSFSENVVCNLCPTNFDRSENLLDYIHFFNSDSTTEILIKNRRIQLRKTVRKYFFSKSTIVGRIVLQKIFGKIRAFGFQRPLENIFYIHQYRFDSPSDYSFGGSSKLALIMCQKIFFMQIQSIRKQFSKLVI